MRMFFDIKKLPKEGKLAYYRFLKWEKNAPFIEWHFFQYLLFFEIPCENIDFELKEFIRTYNNKYSEKLGDPKLKRYYMIEELDNSSYNDDLKTDNIYLDVDRLRLLYVDILLLEEYRKLGKYRKRRKHRKRRDYIKLSKRKKKMKK